MSHGTVRVQWRVLSRRARLARLAYLPARCSSVCVGVQKWACPPCSCAPIACAQDRLCSDRPFHTPRWWDKQREMSTRRKINGIFPATVLSFLCARHGGYIRLERVPCKRSIGGCAVVKATTAVQSARRYKPVRASEIVGYAPALIRKAHGDRHVTAADDLVVGRFGSPRARLKALEESSSAVPLRTNDSATLSSALDGRAVGLREFVRVL